ncbi:MAG: T9SS type A sorting domain-containing protein, partial [Flavobacteriales bacterium]|nr:T9SS type A sorting domain-containing protein [Flavobacteriales bacterium]
GVIVATSGYAAVMPDYIGLGNSPGIHLYQHAHTEATASIDIMRACRMICEEENKPLNDQLFLIGYSQGGHAVMATHRMIQEELFDEFEVTASAPGGGPYDMSGAQLDMVSSWEPYAVPGYLPFLVQSYQQIYGNLYDSIQQIYVPPYDETLPPLLDGSVGMWELNQAMPSVPREIFQPAYADEFFADTLHSAFVALKDNDVYNWVPEAPVMFNYCRSDEEVSYLNTINAADYMLSAGAPDIQVIERDTVLGHYECAQPSIFFSKLWFDTMANFCGEDNVGIEEIKTNPEIELFPNPVSDGIVNLTNQMPLHIQVRDLRGRIISNPIRVKASGMIDLNHLRPGIVLLELITDNGSLTKKLIIN